MDRTFRQLNRKDVDMQVDMDGDGSHERADVVAHVRVVGHGPVTVAAGTFSDALRLEAIMALTISLTKDRRVVVSTDTITSWFARGVGLVKYLERVEMPPIRDTRGEVTHISEELESYTLKRTGGRL
jgi:hypothetical protein